MATHTQTGGGSYGRKFTINRENGQVAKAAGIPHFFEWIKEVPPDTKGRKFESRAKESGKVENYELFKAIDGRLVDIRKEKKTIQEREQIWLALDLQDGADDYTIEVGELDSRFAMDIMKRLLDPNFDPSQTLRLSPFSILDEKSGKYNMGIACMSGVDTKLFADRQKNPNLEGLPMADSRDWKGKTEWDFSPVGNWLWAMLERKVIPRLQSDPLRPTSKGQPEQSWASSPMPTQRAEPEAVITDGDDLPF